MTEVATGREIALNWNLLVTPGIPTVTSDLAPGRKQLMWSPISSTLISGKRDAVLVDTFITVEQADILVDWVAASGKNLTTIYVTHGHGDYFFGIGGAPGSFSQRQGGGHARCCETHAPAGLAGSPSELLEPAVSTPNPGSPRDRRRTQAKCDRSRRARLGRRGSRPFRH